MKPYFIVALGYVFICIMLVKQSSEHVPTKYKLLHMASITFLLISFSTSIPMLGWSLGNPIKAFNWMFDSGYGLPAWIRGIIEIISILTGCFVYALSYYMARGSSKSRVIFMRTISLLYLISAYHLFCALLKTPNSEIQNPAMVSFVSVFIPYILLFAFYANRRTVRIIFQRMNESDTNGAMHEM